jgi:hypothetical protein
MGFTAKSGKAGPRMFAQEVFSAFGSAPSRTLGKRAMSGLLLRNQG